MATRRGLLVAAVLGLCLSAAPPAAALAPGPAQVEELLLGWRAGAAGELLESLPPDSVSLTWLAGARATVLFYRGEYEAALGVAEGAGDEQLLGALRAALQVTEGMSETTTADGHWRIRTMPGPDEVLVPSMQIALPQIRARLGEALGIFPDTPIVVEIYPDPQSLALATGLTEKELEHSGTIAICKFNRIMITSPRATLHGYPWLNTLSHEYAHLLINHRSFQRVPIWLHEGLARYNELRWRAGEPQVLREDTEALLLQALRDDELITFDEMHPSMAKLPTQRHTELAFAEVHTFIEELYKRIGQAGVQRMLDRLARREFDDARDAVADAVGERFARFEAQWKRALRRRRLRPGLAGRALPRVRFRKAEQDPYRQELDDVAAKARDFAYLGQLLRGQGRPKAALREYRKAARIAGRPSPIIQNRIAATELGLGHPEAALEALVGITEAFPNYAPSYVNEGLALLALQREDEAQARFEAVQELNPFDPRPHEHLQRLYAAAGDPRAAQETRAVELLRAGTDPGAGLPEEAGPWPQHPEEPHAR